MSTRTVGAYKEYKTYCSPRANLTELSSSRKTILFRLADHQRSR